MEDADSLLVRTGRTSRPDGAGPIRLTVSDDIGPGRNWTSLWKPTIDGHGPLVDSLPRPAKALDDPRDGRITDLSLHSEINVDLGHTVRIGF